jgi:biotin-dependent carboxylase-like uncharacterized protein
MMNFADLNLGTACFRVLRAGAQTTLQDLGRPGLKDVGIPVGGVMDRQALARLNAILGNAPTAAAYEMLWGGLEVECLADCLMAYTGDVQGWIGAQAIPRDRTIALRAGDRCRFQAQGRCLWSYLSIAGGWASATWFGSASVWPLGGMGHALCDGDVLYAQDPTSSLPPGIAARYAAPYPTHDVSPLRVWRGPQWELFSPAAREVFFSSTWSISQQSNRAGYRLSGPTIEVPTRQLISEPIRLGSIQVPADGQPIVLLNDGPTLGGYHKLALLHHDELDRFRQLLPNSSVSFCLIDECS